MPRKTGSERFDLERVGGDIGDAVHVLVALAAQFREANAFPFFLRSQVDDHELIGIRLLRR